MFTNVSTSIFSKSFSSRLLMLIERIELGGERASWRGETRRLFSSIGNIVFGLVSIVGSTVELERIKHTAGVNIHLQRVQSTVIQ